MNAAMWHNKLERVMNSMKKSKKVSEEEKLKELEGEDDVLQLLKPNWKSLLLKYEDHLEA